MKKAFDLTVRVEHETVDAQSVLRLRVNGQNAKELCLSCDLILLSLVDSVLFLHQGGNLELRGDSSIAFQCLPRGTTMSLRPTDWEYLRTFLLTYLRDGFGRVDHVDFETESGDYITICVDNAAPSVSAQEARRRLGVD
jgi:hypothetical protein